MRTVEGSDGSDVSMSMDRGVGLEVLERFGGGILIVGGVM